MHAENGEVDMRIGRRLLGGAKRSSGRSTLEFYKGLIIATIVAFGILSLLQIVSFFL